jgi:hypothetical protein
MSAAKPDPKLARFIAGTKAPALDPTELQRRLKNYLQYEARLDAIVRQQIFRTPVIRPKAQLDRLIRTYKPGRPDSYEQSEARVLVTQVSDLVDELGSAIEKFQQAEKVFAEQKALGNPDSRVFKTAEECVGYLSKSGAELKKTLKAVHVPKTGGKPDATVKDVHAAASLLITAAMLVAEVSRRVVKGHEQLKDRKP